MKQKTIDFLKDLSWSQNVEINNLRNLLKFNDAFGKENIYFCAWVEKKLTTRCKDSDIKKKKYFVVDIDARLDHYEKTGEVLTEEQLDKEIAEILKKLDSASLLDYSYAVNSWNWLHLYYVGEEREFDRETYSNWVKFFYEQIDEVLKKTNYRCDPATHNLARIMRLPWTINPRKKESKDWVKWDLGDYTTNFVRYQPQKSLYFEMLEEFANAYKLEDEKAKKEKPEVRRIAKDYTSKNDIRSEINSIPAWELAEIVRGVRLIDNWEEIAVLREDKKNMGAYRYKPKNLIVNTGSSLINTQKDYFTPYELVYYEMFNWDVAKTLEYFKNKYGIKVDQKKTIIPEKTKYNIIWYYYPNDVFDSFDCFMSWELVTIVAEGNSGKTTFAMDIIQRNSMEGKKWFYINLEFPIETVRQNRWLFMNNKRKRNLTDIDPLSPEERGAMDRYVKDKLSKFSYYNEPQGMELDDLVELIKQKHSEWYGLIVVDTFSRINGNLWEKARANQNKVMETLQSVAQNIWVALILLHHTSKKGIFEGSQKIYDLSNVFIIITKAETADGEEYRTFEMSKDKFVTKHEVDLAYRNHTYTKL